jgi:hypothetical protein
MGCDFQSGVDGKSGGPNADEEVLRAADPKDGVRLIRAFLRINDPSVRQKIIEMVEQAWPDPPAIAQDTL